VSTIDIRGQIVRFMKLLRNRLHFIYDVSSSASLALAVAVILVIAQAVAGSILADNVTSGQYVLVRRVIDTRYNKTARADAQFDALLSSSIERTYVVKPEDKIQTIFSKLFGIGPKDTPDQYQKLEQHVVKRNGLVRADKIAAGQHLVLPDLAPMQYKEQNPLNPFYKQPRVSMGPALGDVKSGRAYSFDKTAFTTMPEITDNGRKASTNVVQWRWVPLSIAKQEVANSTQVLEIFPMSGEILIHFEDHERWPRALEEIQPDVDYLKRLLARRQPKHQVVLFVLDDSWPDQNTFLESRDFFVDAGNQIRKYFHLGPPEWDANLRKPKIETSFTCDQGGKGRGCHAWRVGASLNPFTGISNKVKVVYLPLFLEQKWSRELWHELLLLWNTALDKSSSLEIKEDPQKDIIDSARARADALIQLYPKVATQDVARTDRSAVICLLNFAHLYARSTGCPCFISMSWTVPKYSFPFGPDPDPMAVSVAAVGNDDTVEIMENKVLLAYRAKEFPGDVLAVMNVHPNGEMEKNCSSSWKADEEVYGFAYSGFLPDECGTSFSTPRVAWLLALRQAYNEPVSTEKECDWFCDYRKYLLSLQDKAKVGPLRYWLSPAKLFEGL
jgi:hypothetical protein